MDYTKSKGNITELTCLMGFMSMGFDCSIPYGDTLLESGVRATTFQPKRQILNLLTLMIG